jgi:AcrR family transcriptional regulator
MAQVKKTEIHDAIIASAYRLFRSQGYLGTSMAEIGRAARIAPSNIYVYFDSKFEIFYATYEPWLKDRLARLELELAEIADPDARIRHILQAIWIGIPSEDNGFANNLMQAVSTAGKDEKYRSDLLLRCESHLSELLKTALPESRASIVENGRLAHILLMAFDGFVVRHHLGALRSDMSQIVDIMGGLIAGTAPKTSGVAAVRAKSGGARARPKLPRSTKEKCPSR